MNYEQKVEKPSLSGSSLHKLGIIWFAKHFQESFILSKKAAQLYNPKPNPIFHNPNSQALPNKALQCYETTFKTDISFLDVKP
jgi:hypothetical protein